MTTTPLHHKTAAKPAAPPTKPVGAVLLELAYLMHATKVVGHRGVPLPRRSSSLSR